MPTPLSYWLAFTGGIIALLVFDLLVLARMPTRGSLRESIITTFVWIALAAAFGLWIFHRGGPAKGLEFFTGYLIEYALSLDNIFIFVLIFASYPLPPTQQRRLLFWGVLGAMLMRGLMIAAGTALLRHLAWIIYLFGAYILYAGCAMLWPKKETPLEDKTIVRFVRRCLPFSQDPAPTRFLVREEGQLRLTLLVLVLGIIESTDLLFALDSVPAVFGVTRDPFIVYTSNICAILGLRSLYFLLAGALKHLTYLQFGLAGVLIFIGAKMIAEPFYALSTVASLLVVVTILLAAIVASLLKPAR